MRISDGKRCRVGQRDGGRLIYRRYRSAITSGFIPARVIGEIAATAPSPKFR